MSQLAAQVSKRLFSLDVFRGLTMFLLIAEAPSAKEATAFVLAATASGSGLFPGGKIAASSTSPVSAFSSPPVARMQLAATKLSVARPFRTAPIVPADDGPALEIVFERFLLAGPLADVDQFPGFGRPAFQLFPGLGDPPGAGLLLQRIYCD